MNKLVNYKDGLQMYVSHIYFSTELKATNTISNI